MIRGVSILALIITLGYSNSVTPQHFNFHFQQLAQFHVKDGLKFFQYSLGVSDQGNQLWAYAWTTMPGVNKVEDLTHKPATLITCLMHARQASASKMLTSFLETLPGRVNADQQLKFMMKHSAIWAFPYVNIDRYYEWAEASPDDKIKFRKNKQRTDKKCLTEYDYGVDINRNFDIVWGTTPQSKDPCGQEYRGEKPFSSPQAYAIKNFYQKFSVKLAIDLHAYGNEWIYPFAYDETGQALKKHPLYYQYEQINKQLLSHGYKVQSCIKSLQYSADGVYIDWALSQGAVSYAFEIGNTFDNGPRLLDDIQRAINSFYIILKHNSYNYKVFKTPNKKLYIQSFSMIDFSIKIQNNQQELGPILVRPGESRVIDLVSPTTEARVLIQGSIQDEIFYLSNLEDKDPKENLTKDIPKLIKTPNLTSLKRLLLLVVVLGILYFGYLAIFKSELKQAKQSKKIIDKPQMSEVERLNTNIQE